MGWLVVVGWGLFGPVCKVGLLASVLIIVVREAILSFSSLVELSCSRVRYL